MYLTRQGSGEPRPFALHPVGTIKSVARRLCPGGEVSGSFVTVPTRCVGRLLGDSLITTAAAIGTWRPASRLQRHGLSRLVLNRRPLTTNACRADPMAHA